MRKLLLVLIAGIVAGMLLFPAAALANFGIDPGKVFIENLSPGSEADIPITITNNNDYETTFTIKMRTPDYTGTQVNNVWVNYEVLPYMEWVTVTPEQVTIRPKGTAKVMVVIVMPKDANYSGKKAETWISFKEKDNPEMVQIELAARLFIGTRAEVKPTSTSTTPSPTSQVTTPTATPSPTAPTTTTGSIGITAEAKDGSKTGIIVGSVVGAIAAAAAVFILVRKKQKKLSR